DLAERVEALVLRRRLGVPREEGVDDDDLAGQRRELGRRLAEPVNLHLRRLRPGGLGGEGVGERARRELQKVAPLQLHGPLLLAGRPEADRIYHEPTVAVATRFCYRHRVVRARDAQTATGTWHAGSRATRPSVLATGRPSRNRTISSGASPTSRKGTTRSSWTA